jgi:hypothetical protein
MYTRDKVKISRASTFAIAKITALLAANLFSAVLSPHAPPYALCWDSFDYGTPWTISIITVSIRAVT